MARTCYHEVWAVLEWAGFEDQVESTLPKSLEMPNFQHVIWDDEEGKKRAIVKGEITERNESSIFLVKINQKRMSWQKEEDDGNWQEWAANLKKMLLEMQGLPKMLMAVTTSNFIEILPEDEGKGKGKGKGMKKGGRWQCGRHHAFRRNLE